MYMCAELEISGVVLLNANRFWGNCESLRLSEL